MCKQAVSRRVLVTLHALLGEFSHCHHVILLPHWPWLTKHKPSNHPLIRQPDTFHLPSQLCQRILFLIPSQAVKLRPMDRLSNSVTAKSTALSWQAAWSIPTSGQYHSLFSSFSTRPSSSSCSSMTLHHHMSPSPRFIFLHRPSL